MTWKFIYTYRERCKTMPAHNRCWKWSPFNINNIIFIDNSLGPLVRESPCIKSIVNTRKIEICMYKMFGRGGLLYYCVLVFKHACFSCLKIGTLFIGWSWRTASRNWSVWGWYYPFLTEQPTLMPPFNPSIWRQTQIQPPNFNEFFRLWWWKMSKISVTIMIMRWTENTVLSTRLLTPMHVKRTVLHIRLSPWGWTQ